MPRPDHPSMKSNRNNPKGGEPKPWTCSSVCHDHPNVYCIVQCCDDCKTKESNCD